MEELFPDWSLRERTRWREKVLELPSWRKRSGRKRTWSKVKSKPGKEKRKRMRLARESNGTRKGEKAACVSGKPEVSLSVQDSSQLSLAVPGLESEVGGQDGGQMVESEVMLEGDVAVSSPGRAKFTPVKRAQSGFRSVRSDTARFQTYDERIEGVGEGEVAFPDNLEFRFKIQKIEDIEV